MRVDVTASSAAIRKALGDISIYDAKSRLGLERAISNATRRIAYRTRANVPIGPTGNLRKSIYSSFSRVRCAGEVGAARTEDSHAHLVEYGVRAHRTFLTGKHSYPPAKALRFMSGGKTVFARVTHIPKIPARPFMAPAYKAEEPKLIDEIAKVMKEAR